MGNRRKNPSYFFLLTNMLTIDDVASILRLTLQFYCPHPRQ
jgi:hypothetical protein